MSLIEVSMECAEIISFQCISTLATGLRHSDLATPLLLRSHQGTRLQIGQFEILDKESLFTPVFKSKQQALTEKM